MKLTITPNTLQGHISAPPSKSAAHRALICAALSDGKTMLRCGTACADVLATQRCLRSLGAEISETDDGCTITPVARANACPVLQCDESGSTLRFLLPIAAALGTEADFRFSERLGSRPVRPLLDVLQSGGCTVTRQRDGLHLHGTLNPGVYSLDASESSQFLSGMMLSLPLIAHSEIRPMDELVSADYVNLTSVIMKCFGVECGMHDGVITAVGAYQTPGEFLVEGDWSGAAFWFAANALGGRIEVDGLLEDSVQGDRAGRWLPELIRSGNASIDCRNIPDLVPVLAVVAAVSGGETRFYHAARLRGKESDRLNAISAMITALGGDCRETEDGLVLRGVAHLHGGMVDCLGDHRIAMAAGVAAMVCAEEVELLGAECVAKSYPDFWRDYRLLGGEVR